MKNGHRKVEKSKINQLDSSNYNFWKIRIQHLMALKYLDDLLEEDPRTDKDSSITAWKKEDKKAQAIIGLTLSDDLLANVREVETAKEMWTKIKNIFQCHTLLNKLSARRKFYTASMQDTESVLKFANRIQQLATALKSMNVTISESEIAMALLNGLPEEYNVLISALDAIDEDETKLKFEFIKSRTMQEEQAIFTRTESALEKSGSAASISTQSPRKLRNNRNLGYHIHRNHCNRPGHYESKCWIEYPHLNPRNKKNSKIKPAYPANQSDEDPIVSLMAKYENANEPKNTDKWFVDSGCCNQMTYKKSLFSPYIQGDLSSIELGNSETTKISGEGTVEIQIIVKGKRAKWKLTNVLRVHN